MGTQLEHLEPPPMTVQTSDYRDVLRQVQIWPLELRLHLAEEILQSLGPSLPTERLPGVPAERVLGIATGTEQPPDDETVRRWLEEHRAEKYG